MNTHSFTEIFLFDQDIVVDLIKRCCCSQDHTCRDKDNPKTHTIPVKAKTRPKLLTVLTVINQIQIVRM